MLRVLSSCWRGFFMCSGSFGFLYRHRFWNRSTFLLMEEAIIRNSSIYNSNLTSPRTPFKPPSCMWSRFVLQGGFVSWGLEEWACDREAVKQTPREICGEMTFIVLHDGLKQDTEILKVSVEHSAGTTLSWVSHNCGNVEPCDFWALLPLTQRVELLSLDKNALYKHYFTHYLVRLFIRISAVEPLRSECMNQHSHFSWF